MYNKLVAHIEMNFRRKKLLSNRRLLQRQQVRMNEAFVSLLRYRMSSRGFGSRVDILSICFWLNIPLVAVNKGQNLKVCAFCKWLLGILLLPDIKEAFFYVVEGFYLV